MVIGGGGHRPAFLEDAFAQDDHLMAWGEGECSEDPHEYCEELNVAIVSDGQVPLPVFDVIIENIEESDAKKEGSKFQEPKKPSYDLNVDEMPLDDYVRYADAGELIHFVSELDWRRKFQRQNPDNAPLFAGVILKVPAMFFCKCCVMSSADRCNGKIFTNGIFYVPQQD